MGATAELNTMESSEDMFATKKDHRNPLVPLGALATAAVLCGGLYSFKQGKSHRSQLFMRARVVMQGATVALMVGTVYASGKQ
ncbi:hypothetical protein MPTK1_5g02950 [Marchantia polymorpha subsp. ruderalis]|uniref:HIG1 domain-containing protein n=2 Tax=Marchantia polymorpha TaxID=3197 RepID=A0A176WAU4_MARPO|nr:hypothetical protein AXG93_3884s1270 [Marchantia polymorpha subsp. ruderalis]PTQ30455.1 hypothetical protein MARPO_0124s0028 [Marchantia polymorpha]BBN10362.1 hypothetical protein Mp_5g02950 [Marchantia polymorpha subsp. ruderalis]|eukprot:PTQ30455.1 hypothetical protein MARPO_0124s0028 [Marchantia polymorpha]